MICGIMQHIEQAGVHSGDSACSIPPQTISEECLAVIRDWTPKLAKALKVVGLINIQYAVQDNQVYIIEANPRASRTVPFVAKAIGHPLASYASLLMSGKKLADLGFTEVSRFVAGGEVQRNERTRAGGMQAQPPIVLAGREISDAPPTGCASLSLSPMRNPVCAWLLLQEPVLNHVAVKEAVLPFDKFAGADTLLGPEMRSTGEVGVQLGSPPGNCNHCAILRLNCL